MTWRAELETIGHTAVLRLHGDLDLMVEGPLREALSQARTSSRYLLVDLGDVRLIDSTGLGLLVRLHQSVKRSGGVVGLVAPSRFIQTVLHTMRLLPVFPIFADTDSALRWLGNGAVHNGPAAPRQGPAAPPRQEAAAPGQTGPAEPRQARSEEQAGPAVGGPAVGGPAVGGPAVPWQASVKPTNQRGAPRSPATGEAGDRGALGRA